jgi:hypothetical protein
VRELQGEYDKRYGDQGCDQQRDAHPWLGVVHL